ncbi:xanthine dehydrogenase molybdopterin binding subunit [Uliginosibacterium sp. H1]|uniref:xanthine dehydrogenase molybdopterin binding subunit n=1 Tax=Uliginosibacterium sp. H1 TaxID=3114757 RepID=UPI002E18D066|nr:xanthine dehydrogenase molybdopterin binding subunit [Uliginosibacterium sp. H1]
MKHEHPSPPIHKVGDDVPHESAALHVSGRATYIDDLPEPAGTLHAAFGLATVAHGRIRKLDLDDVRHAPGVVAVLTAADIPGENNCGPVLHDDPILADELVQFYNQPIFIVVARSHDAARRAARIAKVDYEVLPMIRNAAEAASAGNFVLPPVNVARGDADAALARAPHRLRGNVLLGGQEHFYLEGQIASAQLREDDTLHVHTSTQHPTEMQQVVAHMLGWRQHQVTAECRRIGGGFGGKESQSAQIACAAALAAWKLQRPVKLRLDRDDDMAITGKRHDFDIGYEAGFDDDGMILGVKFELSSRCGFSADLSGPVNDRAIFHADNCYYLDAIAVKSLRGKTNTVSNTAFRGFGGPQGMFAIEYVIDDIARTLDLDPLLVRQRNFYGTDPAGPRNLTHYGMAIEDNVAPALVAQLARDSDYEARRVAIAQFNEKSPVVKRGIALTPLKFGISFTATLFNQAGALVHVYADGTVTVSHGGTEMGQGLYTKIRQIAAHEFGLPVNDVRLTPTDTSRVPNTSATAASSGTDLNGKAVQQAAQAVRERIAAFFGPLHNVAPQDVVFADGMVTADGVSLPFGAVTAQAYRARIQLWDSGFYATPKIHYDAKTMKGRPFFYFAYGASVSEVAIDTLTGETKVLRVDVLHDVGKSINPAVDIGQIEGGFIQGMGWLTTEELWWRPDGKLMTHAPSTYKIPAASDCPPVFNVKLFDNSNVEDSIHRSKAVGEPPLMLPFSVFFAIRDAVAARTGGCPRLDAPATPEAILRALGELPALGAAA